MLLTFHQQLSLRQLKNGNGSPKLLLIDIKCNLSVSPLLSWIQENPLSLSQMFCSTWMLACFQQMIPHLQPPALQLPANAGWSRLPTDPQAPLPGNQRACLPLTHLVPFSVYTGKGNNYPAARNCGRCLQKAQTLPHRGAEDEKKKASCVQC